MFQKIIIYFLLLCFINSAFLPGENEDDTPFNGIEEVEEEYNNLYELIMEGLLGIEDDTPEDEDDDNPDWCKKTNHFFYEQKSFISINRPLYSNNVNFPFLINYHTSLLEKSSPPPKAS